MTTYNLPVPPSTNNLFLNAKHGGRVPTPEYRAWQEEAGWLLQAQKPKLVPHPFRIDIKMSENANIDCDNALKAPIDLLKKHGVIQNDSKKFMRGCSIDYVEGIEGIQVRVTSMQIIGGSR
jgi:Holliday junction resolvase RusA-like endonuclease